MNAYERPMPSPVFLVPSPEPHGVNALVSCPLCRATWKGRVVLYTHVECPTCGQAIGLTWRKGEA